MRWAARGTGWWAGRSMNVWINAHTHTFYPLHAITHRHDNSSSQFSICINKYMHKHIYSVKQKVTNWNFIPGELIQTSRETGERLAAHIELQTGVNCRKEQQQKRTRNLPFSCFGITFSLVFWCGFFALLHIFHRLLFDFIVSSTEMYFRIEMLSIGMHYITFFLVPHEFIFLWIRD